MTFELLEMANFGCLPGPGRAGEAPRALVEQPESAFVVRGDSAARYVPDQQIAITVAAEIAHVLHRAQAGVVGGCGRRARWGHDAGRVRIVGTRLGLRADPVRVVLRAVVGRDGGEDRQGVARDGIRRTGPRVLPREWRDPESARGTGDPFD